MIIMRAIRMLNTLHTHSRTYTIHLLAIDDDDEE